MKYHYQAKTLNGEIKQGIIETENISQAKKILAGKNLFVTKIWTPGLKTTLGNLFNRVSMREKTVFTQEISVMIKAGFSITKALSTLKEQSKNQKLKETLQAVEKAVRDGESLSNALSKYPKIFPEIYTQAIAAGEKSGNLDKILDRLATNMQKSYELSNKIKSAMVYPVFVFGVMILILIAMLIFVIPQLKTLFEDMNVTLPATTQFLLFLSNFFIKFWWLILLIIIILIIVYKTYYNTPKGHYNIDKLKIKLPLISSINQKIYLANFTRDLNILMSAGLPILDIMQTLEKTVGNKIYSEEIKKARKKIESGETISQALKPSPYFSPLTVQLIKVGEESGNLTDTLNTVTNFLENEIDNTTKGLSSLIEPILIVVLGIGAAFIVAAIIMPIYSLTEVIT